MGTPTEETRKLIDNYEEFEKRNTRFELLVSYDCSNKHDPFRDKLRALLVDEKKSIEENESLYRLPKPLTISDIENLTTQIEKLFETILNENTSVSTTKVQFILPDKNSFNISTIIHKKA